MAIDLTTIMAARLARRDVPRDEARIRVRVNSTSDGLVYAGHVLRCGVQEIEIYESELAPLLAMLEREGDKLALAQADYEAHLDEIKDKKGETSRTFYPSLSASFRHLHRRDVLPLRLVEVVTDKPAVKSDKRAA